jgi:hypothetical protein
MSVMEERTTARRFSGNITYYVLLEVVRLAA